MPRSYASFGDVVDAFERKRKAEPLDSLTDEEIVERMEIAVIGKDYGLAVAHQRLDGDAGLEPLSWAYVRARLRRDD